MSIIWKNNIISICKENINCSYFRCNSSNNAVLCFPALCLLIFIFLGFHFLFTKDFFCISLVWNWKKKSRFLKDTSLLQSYCACPLSSFQLWWCSSSLSFFGILDPGLCFMKHVSAHGSSFLCLLFHFSYLFLYQSSVASNAWSYISFISFLIP